MAYGDYDGPDKPNKGHEGGACNRQRCQAEPALWYNHGSYSWYCIDCAISIGADVVNLRDWNYHWEPKCGHPQFETREMMDARITFDSDVPAEVITGKLARQQGKTYVLGKGRLYFDPPLKRPEGEPVERRYHATWGSAPESRQVRRARERAERKALPPGERFLHRYR